MSDLALEGDLRIFQPAELLQLLQLAQASGRFELERGSERVDLVFKNGRLISARTSGVAVHVGDVLVHRGVLTRDALELVLSMQQDQPGERIGHMLVTSGAVTEAQAVQAIREVVSRVVYGVLLWREGRFRFAPGEEESPEDIRLDLDLDRLILEGLRLADQKRAS
jgi:glycine/D-amino acid oxidase-like deaminating enzyme